MSISCDFTDLIKDDNVRYILQRIRDEIKVSRADNPHVLTKIPSFNGRVELFNQNAPEENDEHFIRCLNDKDVIANIKFEKRYPNKNKGDIDYSLLNSPEEFTTPYIAVSFDISDRQFLNNLYNRAVDALIVNPYPVETQQDLVNTAIVKTKAQTQTDEITLSWDEIDKEDRKHIGIWQALKGLETEKQINILKFEAWLDKYSKYGNTDFTTRILYTPIVPFTGKGVVSCGSLLFDTKNRKAFYPKLKNKSKNTSFVKDNENLRVLEGFITKSNHVLTYTEIYLLILPPSQSCHKALPNKFDRTHKRKIEKVIKYLRDKFNNLDLITYVPDDRYRLTP